MVTARLRLLVAAVALLALPTACRQRVTEPNTMRGSSNGAYLADGGLAPEVPVREPSCSALDLNVGTALLETSRCVRSSAGAFDCNCPGGDVRVLSDGGTNACAVVLDAACDRDTSDRATCEIEDIGVCRPTGTASGAWDCLCEGSHSTSHVTETGDCKAAVFAACVSECTTKAGTCTPSPGALTYECDCGLYGPRTVAWDGYACEQALRNFCEPGDGLFSWGSCTNHEGYCNQLNNQEPTWSCHCVDGSSGEATLESRGTGLLDDPEPECGQALEQVCGKPVAPPETACNRETEDGSASCTLANDVDAGMPAFACVCTLNCTEPAGASGSVRGGIVGGIGGTVFPGDCDHAMDLACGVGGPLCD